jgi:Flp pilus assembly protein TadD
VGIGIVAVAGLFLSQVKQPPSRRNAVIDTPINRLAPPAISQQIPPVEADGAMKNPAQANGGQWDDVGAGGAMRQLGEGAGRDLNKRAVELLAAGDPTNAISLLQKATALQPRDETFHFNLGVAFAKAGQLTNAETEYKEALRLRPDYTEANNNCGNLLFHFGRLSEAETYLSEAVKETPDSAVFNNNLGVLQQRLKKTNEAFASFKKAVACDSNYMQAHFGLAQSYLDRKERDNAIVQLKETLRIKPGFEPAKRALARINAGP